MEELKCEVEVEEWRGEEVGVRSWSWRAEGEELKYEVEVEEWRLKSLNSWGCGILSAPHRIVRASRTCKSGMNNAARKIEHPILGAAESLPMLNKEFKILSLRRKGFLRSYSEPPPPPLLSATSLPTLFAFLCALCELCVSLTKDQHLYPRLHLPSLYFLNAKNAENAKKRKDCYR